MTNPHGGVLEETRKGASFLRSLDRSFRPDPSDIYVPTRLAQKFGLVQGAWVSGPVVQGKKGPVLNDVLEISGLSPEEFQNRVPFSRLTPINPTGRFRLCDSGNMSMRVVDLIAPVARGTRGLIVSPPRAGKTMLLEDLARAIQEDAPQTRIIVLLIDERPEEVTHFRRAVNAEVLASTNDLGVREHVQLLELVMAHIRIELECGRDVVVLVDSLTRIGRAFNLREPDRRQPRRSGRTMSGGMEAGALEIPRRFFGLARNIENGGSVTILATCLVDTNSRMDQLIFEEFKGTGNSEIVLDRSLAEQRIFPAIDIPKSGTRKEEELYEPELSRKIALLRRALAGTSSKEAVRMLLRKLEKYPTNEDFLKSLNLP